jgi:enoyl-CoA hydratase
MSAEVLVSVDDGILTVRINRPEARNAINLRVAEAIAGAMDQLDGDPTIRLGILTGAGNTFSSGMDLKAFVAGERPYVRGRGFGGLCEASPAKPLIAAVEGYALAGGFELAIACDLIVAAEDAKFGIPEAKRGLVAGAGGLLRLPRQISPRVAMELALTGEFISARRAFELGLINRVVKSGSAYDESRGIARAIAANGPLAVVGSKRVIVESRDWPSDEMFLRQSELIGPIFNSQDAVEGAKAFAEKRAPVWHGR